MRGKQWGCRNFDLNFNKLHFTTFAFVLISKCWFFLCMRILANSSSKVKLKKRAAERLTKRKQNGGVFEGAEPDENEFTVGAHVVFFTSCYLPIFWSTRFDNIKVVLHLKIFKNSNFFLPNCFIIYVVSNLKKVVWMKKF